MVCLSLIYDLENKFKLTLVSKVGIYGNIMASKTSKTFHRVKTIGTQILCFVIKYRHNVHVLMGWKCANWSRMHVCVMIQSFHNDMILLTRGFYKRKYNNMTLGI